MKSVNYFCFYKNFDDHQDLYNNAKFSDEYQIQSSPESKVKASRVQ